MTSLSLYVQDKLLFIFLFPVCCDSLINCTCLFSTPTISSICLFRMYESQTDWLVFGRNVFDNYALKVCFFTNFEILAVGTTEKVTF